MEATLANLEALESQVGEPKKMVPTDSYGVLVFVIYVCHQLLGINN